MWRALGILLLLTSAAHAGTITVGSLTLTHCIEEYDGYCGSITQPLDRSLVYPGTVTVGFEFYPHTDTSQSPAGIILAQEGGPGYSTTGSRDGYVRLFTPLRNRRDILLIDKRGTGRSSAIDCPALQAAYNPTQRDIAACAIQLGASAWFYRSADAADDLAAVMAALQVGPADYYGDSYGTWFGQVLAVLHPHLLRSIVLDSAYPVLNDHSDSEVNAGQLAMDKACARSAPCAALGAPASTRFAALLEAVRHHKVYGTAPGANGEPRSVVVDPPGLFLIVANAGNAPVAWRDLDAAGRAWMNDGDGMPLLRLVAEARDSYSGGGGYKGFSVGLADAVQCAEYGTNFNLYSSLPARLRQYDRSIGHIRENAPNQFAPFSFNDALFSQMNAEDYNTCLTWAPPAAGVIPQQPIPPGAVFPDLPVLVLSGELDTVTSPSEGRATAALFPHAAYFETRNLVHESAIGDAGVFVPPNGQDLAGCIGPIVRQFMRTSGDTGDTSCMNNIRPIRTVPAFATSYQTVAPAQALPGNQVNQAGLVLASAVAETVGDAMARYYVTTSGAGSGLRGGQFTVRQTANGYRLDLRQLHWAQDLAVSGTLNWNQLTGAVAVDANLTAAGHTGDVHLAWNDRQTEAVATLTGVVDGAILAAQRIAP